MKIAARIFLLCFCLLPPAAIAQQSKKTAVALESCPYFEKPEQGLLPKGFLEKRDTCTTDSTFVDSSGTPWFHVRVKNTGAWVMARAMRYVSDVPPNFFSQEAKGDEDKKRRMEIIKNHQEWPFRIKKAVHNGQVCIDMSEEQLIASWGEPVERRKSFMLGVGEYVCFFYKGNLKGALLVSLQNGRVIGWSVEE